MIEKYFNKNKKFEKILYLCSGFKMKDYEIFSL